LDDAFHFQAPVRLKITSSNYSLWFYLPFIGYCNIPVTDDDKKTPVLQGLGTFIAFMGVLGGRQKPQSG